MKVDLVYIQGLYGPSVSLHWNGFEPSKQSYQPKVLGVFRLEKGEDSLGFEELRRRYPCPEPEKDE